MYKDSMVFIGLDTHKETTEVAYTLDSRDDSVIHFGKINRIRVTDFLSK